MLVLPILLNIFCPIHHRAHGSVWLEAAAGAVGAGISSGAIVSEAVEPGGLPCQVLRVDAELIVTQVRDHPCCRLVDLLIRISFLRDVWRRAWVFGGVVFGH
jgi:small ligand-binding sensory domain FIST